VGIDSGVRHALEPVLEQSGHGRLTDPAQGKAAQGHAQLHRGQEIFHIFLQAANRPGSGAPQGNQALNAGFADAYQGKFGRHKEPIRQDEQGDGNHPKEHQFNHYAPKPGIRS
jgi:hypothetical protein